MGENLPSNTINNYELFDYFKLLGKWKKFIIINFLIVTVAALVVSFLLPQWFLATATVLPPQNQSLSSSMLGGASSLLKSLPLGGKLGGAGSGTYNHLAILNSRTAMERVVTKFDLITVYEVSDKSLEKTIKQLRENTSFTFTDEDYISIEVYDKNPQRAADIANYFVDILNEMSIALATIEGKNNRIFIEKRLAQRQEELKKSEEALKTYQQKSEIIIMPDNNNNSN